MECDCGTPWDSDGVCLNHRFNTFNVAIVGSRSFNDFEMLVTEMDKVLKDQCKRIKIISGGADGADTLAERYAKLKGYELEVHEAEWKDLSHPDARIKVGKYGQYDANAGFRRNTTIVERADVVCAFHNGSPGTRNTLYKVKKAGKKLYEFRF